MRDVAAVRDVADACERHRLREARVKAGQPRLQAARQQAAHARRGVCAAARAVLLDGPLQGAEDALRRARVVVGPVVAAALGAGDGAARDPGEVHVARGQRVGAGALPRRRVHEQAARDVELGQPVGRALVARDQVAHGAGGEARRVPHARALVGVVIAAHEHDVAALPLRRRDVLVARGQRRRRPRARLRAGEGEGGARPRVGRRQRTPPAAAAHAGGPPAARRLSGALPLRAAAAHLVGVGRCAAGAAAAGLGGRGGGGREVLKRRRGLRQLARAHVARARVIPGAVHVQAVARAQDLAGAADGRAGGCAECGHDGCAPGSSRPRPPAGARAGGRAGAPTLKSRLPPLSHTVAASLTRITWGGRSRTTAAGGRRRRRRQRARTAGRGSCGVVARAARAAP